MNQNTDNFSQPIFNQDNEINSNKYNENSKKSKTKIILIIAIVIVLLIAIIIGVKLFGGNSFLNNSGHTVGYGETLEINEMKGYYNFDVNVISIEKNHSIKNYFYDGNCLALKINIKNKSESNLNLLSLIKFNLINSSDNEIASANMLLSSIFEGSIDKEISSGTTGTGYLYFYNIDDDGNISNIDDSDISKLKVSVPKELEKSDGVVNGSYNNYYIKLK